MRFVYYLRHVILNKILFDTEHLCCIFLHIKSIGYTILICFTHFLISNLSPSKDKTSCKGHTPRNVRDWDSFRRDVRFEETAG